MYFLVQNMYPDLQEVNNMARPKEFDREEVLQKALYTFWEKGYDATTLPDLLESMGVNRSSFYNTFGDKQTLFREVMSL